METSGIGKMLVVVVGSFLKTYIRSAKQCIKRVKVKL